MSNALVRRSGNGVVPAVCSACLPGLGQLVNGDTDKAIGVFAVVTIAGASFLGAIPLLGGAATLILGATWLYGVADAYVTGRRK
jgi:hypothetical protein